MFSSELFMVVVLLVISVWFIFGMWLFLFISLVCLVMLIRVLELLNRLMKRKVKIMLIRLMFSVFLMFSWRKVGVSDGGIEIMLLNWVMLSRMVMVVIIRILISIVLVMLCVFRVMIRMKLRVVRIGVGLVRLFMLIRVVGLFIMMLVFCRVISVRNRLMLVVIVECSGRGMLLMIYLWM